MLSVVKMLLLRVIGSQLVVNVIMTFLQNLLSFGNEIAPKALVYIVEASGMDVSNEERFYIVLEKLKKDFPDVGGSFLRTVIETTFDSWNAGNLN